MSTESQNSEPLLSRAELLSVATLVGGTFFAILAIVCRWFVTYQGQGLRLLLIAGSLTSTLLMLGRINATKPVERICVYVFAAFAVLALLTWSPDFAFAVMVASPLFLILVMPGALRKLGYEIQLQATKGSEPGLSFGEESTIPAGIEITASQTIDAEACDIADDPWAAVQGQFDVDATLVQNVTQWEEPDGTRCVVANIRCRFSAPDETSIVQLPFWPILKQSPEVFCRVASGPDATVKTTQELPHGLRLEVRLDDRNRESGPAFREDVIVEVIASDSAESTERAA